jgi:hypothetical protein
LWSKYRINLGQEFVVGGYIPSHLGVDSLVVGFYRGKGLIYAARVRAGLVPAMRREMFERIQHLRTPNCPFTNLPELAAGRWGQGLTAEKMKGCVWLRPEVVARSSSWRERHRSPETYKVRRTHHVVTMTCVLQRVSEGNALVTFDEAGRIAGLYFGPRPTEGANQWSTPSYTLVDSFHEVPVTVEDGPWHLPGTLTLPNGKGRFPAVALVPGSPQWFRVGDHSQKVGYLQAWVQLGSIGSRIPCKKAV